MLHFEGFSNHTHNNSQRRRNRRLRHKLRQYDREHLTSDQIEKIQQIHDRNKNAIQADQPRC